MLTTVMSFVGIGVIVWTLMFVFTLATGKEVKVEVKDQSALGTMVCTVLTWPMIVLAVLTQITKKLL